MDQQESLGDRLGKKAAQFKRKLGNLKPDDFFKSFRESFEKEETEGERKALLAEAMVDEKFLVALAKGEGYSKEIVEDPENDDVAAEYITTRYKAYKGMPKIQVELKALYTDLLRRETEGLNLGKKSATDSLRRTLGEKEAAEILNLIDSETEAMLADDPESLNKLYETMQEHTKLLDEIKDLEKQQEAIKGKNNKSLDSSKNVEHLLSQAEIVAELTGEQLKDAKSLSVEQKLAVKEMATHLGVDAERLPKEIKSATERLKAAKGDIEGIEEKLSDLEDKIKPTREALFVVNNIGKRLAEITKQKTEEGYRAAVEKASAGKGDLKSLEEAMHTRGDMAVRNSEVGIDWQEFKDQAPTQSAELERLAEENLVAALLEEVKKQEVGKVLKLMNTAKAHQRTKLGTIQGEQFAELLRKAAKGALTKLEEAGDNKAVLYRRLLAQNKFLD